MARSKKRQRVLIITGTAVPPFVAETVYGPLMNALGAELTNLKSLGLAHTMRSVESAKKVIDAGETPVALVGHSQGGLVATILDDMYPELVSKVITLGAPLTGTSLCHLFMPVPSLRCMSHGSRMTEGLQPLPNMHNIVGTNDKLIIPKSSGLLPGAHHHVVEGVSHTGLIYDGQVLELIKSILAESSTNSTRAKVAAKKTPAGVVR